VELADGRHTLLNPGVQRREVWAWAFLDFANSGYTTVVLTAVYSAYFVGAVAGGAPWATLLWTVTVSASSLIAMIALPGLGMWADRAGGKRRIILLASIGCSLATLLLGLIPPQAIAAAVILVALSSLAFSLCETFTAAFLRELARPHALGRVSGWGWSLGYLGGMLTLGLSLAYVLAAKARGESAAQFVPVTLAIVAVVYLGVSLPALAVLKERQQRGGAWEGGWIRLRSAWQQTSRFPDLRALLWCCVAYQSGIFVVITLAAVYAEQVMGFQQTDTMMLVFLVNIAAALGALAFGRFQDHIGHSKALAITLVAWILMVVIAVLGESRASFWVAACIAGLTMGSSQSAGRAMVGQLTPLGQQSAFFALWGFAVRLSAIIGPITYGVLVWLSGGQQRIALAVVGLSFVLGLVLLARVNLARGVAAAMREERGPREAQGR